MQQKMLLTSMATNLERRCLPQEGLPHSVARLCRSRTEYLPPPRTASLFSICEHDFLLDGKPLQIRCGEMYFARVSCESWRPRRNKKAEWVASKAPYQLHGHDNPVDTGVRDLSDPNDIPAGTGM